MSEHKPSRLHTELRLGPDEDAAEFLQGVLTTVPAFITRLGPDLSIRYINQVVPGLSRDAVIGSSVFDFIAAEDHVRARACFEAVLESGHPSMYSGRGTGPDDSVAFYDNLVTAVQDPEGGRGLCVVAMDVTERQTAVTEASRTAERLRVTVESTGLALWDWDLRNGDVTWDARMQELMGCEAPAELDAYVERLVHPDDREAVKSRTAAAFAGEWDPTPHRIVRASDGEVRWVSTMGRVLFEDGEPVRIIGGTTDRTREMALSEQLRQAQKMEAVGVLTAGVAHNFNNVLTVILPALDLLRGVTPETHIPLLDEARRSSVRAAEMVKQLMKFSGQRKQAERQVCDMQDLVTEAVSMCRRTFDRQIRIDAHTTPGLLVSGHVADLQQVLLNILINARDAVLEQPVNHPAVTVEASRDDAGRVVIRVEDNGPGIDASLMSQLFQPFVTTKVSIGTGLGLATSQAIINEHGGTLACESEPGEGAVFVIRLPPAPASATTGPRVLVVDDEHAVLQVVTMVLERVGYHVTTAASVRDARARLDADSQFDVVLLDRSMPELSGTELLPDIHTRAPNARILMFTGEPMEVTDAIDGVILKPVDAETLREAVGRALDNTVS